MTGVPALPIGSRTHSLRSFVKKNGTQLRTRLFDALFRNRVSTISAETMVQSAGAMVEVGDAIASEDRMEQVGDPHELLSEWLGGFCATGRRQETGRVKATASRLALESKPRNHTESHRRHTDEIRGRGRK